VRRWNGRFERTAVFALAAAALGIAIVLRPGLVALIAPSLIGILLLVLIVRSLIKWPEDASATRRVLRWTMIAFGTHLAFGLIVTVLATPLVFLRSDSLTYHDAAISLIRHWTNGDPIPRIPAGKEGFYYTLAWIYSVFGAHAAAGLVFNATVGAAVVPVVTDSTHRLFGVRAARYVPPLVVLLPGMFLWTSQLLKEAGAVFLIVVAANCAIRLTQRVAVAPLIGLTAAISALFTYRGPLALVVAAGLVCGIAVARPAVISGLGIAAGAVALLALALVTVGVGLAGYRAAVDADLSSAQVVRSDLANSANSGFDPDADVSTPRRAATYLPLGMVHFGLGPFPWQLRSASQLAGLPDVLVWWWLLPSLWAGGRLAYRRIGRKVTVLALPTLLASVVLALAVGNFGTLVRERVQVVSLVIPIIALGLAERAARRAGDDDHADVEASRVPALSVR
jgi:hypothetical protein